MKTIIFCAATLLISGLAMGQQATVVSQTTTSASGAVSNNPGTIQGSSAVKATSSANVDADARPAIETSKRAVSRAESEVESTEVSVHSNNKSSTGASISSSQEVRPRSVKQKKANVRTNANVSAGSNIGASNIQASGIIRTNAGLGL